MCNAGSTGFSRRFPYFFVISLLVYGLYAKKSVALCGDYSAAFSSAFFMGTALVFSRMKS